MKASISYIASAFVVPALAFPAAVFDAAKRDPAVYKQLANEIKLEKRLNGVNPGFNAQAQYISTSGEYAWVAPTSTDLRGPCPGLNAFANHGYIPHNGVATIQQFIDATTKVVGMGEDLAAFLAIYGAVFDGDLTSWSIGGPTPLVGLPLLGTPEGISGSHNKYEADVSPTRGDLYQVGNDYQLVLDQFKGQYTLQAGETEESSNFDLGILTSWRITRFQQSISENPYFFNNFFSGVAVQPAAYTFQYRFMANHSAEYPEGRLSQSNLKDWFGVTGDYPNFEHTPGYERIPNNWYRRAFGDEYTIPFFMEDLIAAAVQYPQFLDIGGNTGTVNSFAGIDLETLTGGVYNTQDLTDPTKLSCFLYQMITQQAPDIIENLGSTGTQLLASGLENLIPAGVTCPKLNTIQQSQFDQAFAKFPGYTQLGANGQYST